MPPAIAIDQTNPVRSSRSTVGTMTELNDHLKLLFARAAELFDRQTAQPRAPRFARDHLRRAGGAHQSEADPRLVVTFPVELPAGTSEADIEQWLAASGFTRVQAQRELASPTGPRTVLDVVADRFRLQGTEKVRAIEAIEWRSSAAAGAQCLCVGDGLRQAQAERRWPCGPNGRWVRAEPVEAPAPRCGVSPPACTAPTATSAMPIRSRRCSVSTRPTAPATPAAVFGRVIGVDYGLVIPDHRKDLRAGAIKPTQTPAWANARTTCCATAARPAFRATRPVGADARSATG